MATNKSEYVAFGVLCGMAFGGWCATINEPWPVWVDALMTVFAFGLWWMIRSKGPYSR
jgi:hypothetical protein